jgi:hypothetical protein
MLAKALDILGVGALMLDDGSLLFAVDVVARARIC